MKQTLHIVASALVVGIVLSFANVQTSHGEEIDVITDVQLRAIRAQCTELQATLHRVHQGDALLRHNRGQLYKTISDKLMVPLNQRIASNQLDGSSLVSVTATYNTTYQSFYDSYKAYENAISSAMRIDCSKNPTQFYDAVADARQKRMKLHADSSKLVSLAGQYKKAFDTFRDEQIGGDND